MYDKTIFSQPLAIDRFIYAVENELYIEAHELLEEDWKNFKKNGEKDKAKALQGLINGATALALYFIKNKPNAYKKVWPVFKKYKPLLDSVNLDNLGKYHIARDLLIKKNHNIK
ncbi:MAG: DUF309 domain-containing protein [Arcobacter sp.]|nr:MAG: DUF309 domain-containing protein [Arcobacter sp.]